MTFEDIIGQEHLKSLQWLDLFQHNRRLVLATLAFARQKGDLDWSLVYPRFHTSFIFKLPHASISRFRNIQSI